MLTVIKKQYPNPEDLPYHIIVPSLPGYAFSSSPPIDRDFKADDMAPVMNALMVALGFGSGYIAQGGDLGSFIARQLGVENEECKVNLYQLPAPSNASSLPISQTEKLGLERAKAFTETGSAYAREHGTRTATIGLVLSSSPLALLTWIGEKFLEWTDADPTLDEILDSMFGPGAAKPRFAHPSSKPQGYSYFPKEISPTPVSWVKETGNFVHTASHEEGGHFAAMEKPEVLWGDVEEFVKAAWK
ncbi:alpha/beta-hydrolase [Aureobasidium pullulans]|nr:alpha/beta-hydrolase [Aureobasidium pullulans]